MNAVQIHAPRMRLIPRPSAATSADVDAPSAPPAEPTPAQQAERIADRIRHAMPQADLWAMRISPAAETYLVAHGREEVRVPARDAVAAATRYALVRLPLVADSLTFGASGLDQHGERRFYFDSEAGPIRARRMPTVSLRHVPQFVDDRSAPEREDTAA